VPFSEPQLKTTASTIASRCLVKERCVYCVASYSQCDLFAMTILLTRVSCCLLIFHYTVCSHNVDALTDQSPAPLRATLDTIAHNLSVVAFSRNAFKSCPMSVWYCYSCWWRLRTMCKRYHQPLRDDDWNPSRRRRRRRNNIVAAVVVVEATRFPDSCISTRPCLPREWRPGRRPRRLWNEGESCDLSGVGYMAEPQASANTLLIQSFDY
jgi:hypothetical protein